MNIKKIYLHFNTPPNLREHMIRVAKVVMLIKENWTGPSVDWDILLKSALLHDMGNIVRFKFDTNTEIYGLEAHRLEYWKKVQRDMINKYSSDDHEATRSMLREINVDSKIVDAVLSKSFANAEAISESDSWLDKILLYADMRVLPNKVGSLKERLDELKSRRADLENNPTIGKRFKACEDLETQIQKQLSVPVSAITNELIESIDLQIETVLI